MFNVSCARSARSETLFHSAAPMESPGSFREALLAKLNDTPGIEGKAEGLIAKISNLMDTAEKTLDRIAARLSLSLPPGFELRQTVSMTQIKVVGFGGHGKRFEEAVNNDYFFRQTFQAVRIQYTTLRAFEAVPRSTYACFTMVFRASKLDIKAPAKAGELFEQLLKELDKGRERKDSMFV